MDKASHSFPSQWAPQNEKSSSNPLKVLEGVLERNLVKPLYLLSNPLKYSPIKKFPLVNQGCFGFC